MGRVVTSANVNELAEGVSEVGPASARPRSKKERKYAALGLPAWSPTAVLPELEPAYIPCSDGKGRPWLIWPHMRREGSALDMKVVEGALLVFAPGGSPEPILSVAGVSGAPCAPPEQLNAALSSHSHPAGLQGQRHAPYDIIGPLAWPARCSPRCRPRRARCLATEGQGSGAVQAKIASIGDRAADLEAELGSGLGPKLQTWRRRSPAPSRAGSSAGQNSWTRCSSAWRPRRTPCCPTCRRSRCC